MRLIPASLAGRVTVVLIGGLFLTLAASLAVAVGERVSGEEVNRYPLLVSRIAALVTAANWTEPARRPELLAALSTAAVEAVAKIVREPVFAAAFDGEPVAQVYGGPTLSGKRHGAAQPAGSRRAGPSRTVRGRASARPSTEAPVATARALAPVARTDLAARHNSTTCGRAVAPQPG